MPELEIQSDGPVWDLVAEFLERRERGDAVNVDAFVEEHPEVAERLRDCLAGFQWMDSTALSGRAGGDEVLPRTFGNYELLRVIGRGGMGCVYEAMHRPLKRHVAVKVLPPHMTHVREFRLRFLREARVVASLHHTHIAPVFEVGQIANTLYLAMPFIDGPNLRELALTTADEQPPLPRTLRDRLPPPFSYEYFRWVAEIGVQAGDALAHAHGRGVIHRDVKPSNLIVDEHGEIWIVDFGLAKGPAHPTVTQPGELIGTLRYASPEQIRGERFDERTDVYSLGVTLYELLTRRPAFGSGSESTVLMTEPLAPRRMHAGIPRDLETIVLRAMAKRPQDRFATAAALADDLRRFLRDEPIRARPIGVAGRLVRWCRRNKAMSAVIATAAVLLATLACFDHFRLVAQRDREAEAKQTAELRQAELREVMAGQLLDSGQPGRVERAIDMIREAGRTRFREELWELAIKAADQLDTWPGPELKDAPGAPGFAVQAISPSGTLIAAVNPDGKLVFWNTADGESWSCEAFREPLMRLRWSPTSDVLVAVSPKHVWTARVNAAARELEDVHAVRHKPAAIAWSGDGKQLALWGATLAVYGAAQGDFVWERPSPRANGAWPTSDPYQFAAWSRDGKLLVAVPRGEATLEFWSMPDGEPLPPIGVVDIEATSAPRGSLIGDAAFGPDNLSLACGCADGVIRIFNRETGVQEHLLRGHDGPVQWLDYLGTNWLISADEHEVRLWDMERGRHPGVLVQSDRRLVACSVDRSAKLLVALDAAGALRSWRLPDLGTHRVIGPESYRVTALATSEDGRQLAWADSQGQVKITDLDRAEARTQFDTGLSGVQLIFTPGGKSLVIAGRGDPPIQIRSLVGNDTRPLAAGSPAVVAAALAGSRDRLATVHDDGSLVIWNVETATPFKTVSGESLTVLAASHGGKWLAAGSRTGALHLWNAESMRYTRVAGHDGPVLGLAFSPDDRSIVSVGEDGQINRWKVPKLSRELSFSGPGTPLRDVVFCLDGSTLATCSGDGRVMLWAADRAQRIGPLVARFPSRFDVLAVTPDGRHLIAAGGPRQTAAAGPGSVEIWDLHAIHQSVVAAELPNWLNRDDAGK